MEKAQGGDSQSHKSRKLWGLLIIVLLLAPALIYLNNHGFEWQELASVRREAPKARPTKPTTRPTEPSETLPSFDLVYADDSGKLVAAGRGEANWTIQLSTNTQMIGETKADDNNEWVLTPDTPLPPGEHLLSLVEIDPVSKRGIPGQKSITLSIAPRQQVAQRQNAAASSQEAAAKPETTPKPAETTATAPQAATNSKTEACSVAVVKSGDTLWGLADRCYGDGTQYTKIYDSNRQKVRNPNLIYPDQELSLPH